MSEEKRNNVIQAINKAYPYLAPERRGYLLGYAEAMADRQDDEARQRDKEEKEPA